MGAIAAGFGYVAMQGRISKRERLANESQTREHMLAVAKSAVFNMEDRIAFFTQAQANGDVVAALNGPSSMFLMGTELFAIRPTDCGSVPFALAAKEAAVHILAFSRECAEACLEDKPVPERTPAALINAKAGSEAAVKKMEDALGNG